MKSPSQRRWFRFSLRTLLVFVTIASAGFGWFGMKVRQARRQRAAVEAIEKLNGYVMYDFQTNPYDFHASPPGPDWLHKVLGVDFLASVTFVSLKSHGPDRAHVTDGDLVPLQDLGEIRTIQLDWTEISDAGLLHLKGLTQMKMLSIRDTRVTATGCQKLWNSLPNLKISR
jgi:hypothetical protein